MRCKMLKIENKKRAYSKSKSAKWEHMAVKAHEGSRYVSTKCGKKVQARTNECKCEGSVLLQTRLAITMKEKYKIKMFKGHVLRRMIEGERTRVWCRRCAGYAEPKLVKLVFFCAEGKPGEEKAWTDVR